ncbi:TetR/AcrR family transcriptional regulator [Catellatospora bangladeshensis]|uniref:TetR family transcriptional regulator n=1 Tax=Catellatospora bangladeshensis TaxID=310355 RepID=A0A8J3JIP8_9ACTN|nr:TetR/AcrR family transcriptional regulator [Catellatospora bangladeshensis]GIF81157.1 TetR family transcriptional regulator [Catellatospora bangladeshensis]
MPDPDTTLRDRLVAVGVELVSSDGTGALTLREIARRAGVSHGAPRRYFPTHLSLLSAIAREGYLDLGRRLAGLGDDADPRAALLALARRYLDFAHTQRGMFELMFRHELLRGNQIGLREASRELFGVLVGLVGRARAGVPAPPPVVVAGALWANLHGIAQLWQWGSLQMTVQTEDVDPLLRAALDAHLGPA